MKIQPRVDDLLERLFCDVLFSAGRVGARLQDVDQVDGGVVVVVVNVETADEKYWIQRAPINNLKAL